MDFSDPLSYRLPVSFLFCFVLLAVLVEGPKTVLQEAFMIALWVFNKYLSLRKLFNPPTRKG